METLLISQPNVFNVQLPSREWHIVVLEASTSGTNMVNQQIVYADEMQMKRLPECLSIKTDNKQLFGQPVHIVYCMTDDNNLGATFHIGGRNINYKNK